MKCFSNFKITSLVIIALFNACTKDIKLTLPEHKPALVLNSVFNPDSTFKVDLSANRSIFSNQDFKPVENASIQLFKNGNYLTDLQHIKEGIYTTPIKPETLQKYTIKAAAAGFPDITAHNDVPLAPSVRQVQAKAAYTRVEEYYKGVDVSFTLDAPSTEENFYYLRAYAFVKDNAGNDRIQWIGIQLQLPVEKDFSVDDKHFFSDKLFQGKSASFKLHLVNNPKSLDYTIYLKIAHISKVYYDYEKTFSESISDLNFNQEAVSNNIENGMGIFAGYNAITVTIKP
jgi:hypothetical protein